MGRDPAHHAAPVRVLPVPLHGGAGRAVEELLQDQEAGMNKKTVLSLNSVLFLPTVCNRVRTIPVF